MALLNRTFFFSLLCSFAICRSFVFFFLTDGSLSTLPGDTRLLPCKHKERQEGGTVAARKCRTEAHQGACSGRGSSCRQTSKKSWSSTNASLQTSSLCATASEVCNQTHTTTHYDAHSAHRTLFCFPQPHRCSSSTRSSQTSLVHTNWFVLVFNTQGLTPIHTSPWDSFTRSWSLKARTRSTSTKDS